MVRAYCFLFASLFSLRRETTARLHRPSPTTRCTSTPHQHPIPTPNTISMQLRPRNHPPSASTLSDYFASSRPQSKKRKVEKDSNHQDHSKPPKRTRYIHAPGKTPFPEWSHPTPEECLEVRNLLESVHGESVSWTKTWQLV